MKNLLAILSLLSILSISCDKEGAPEHQEPSHKADNPFKLIFKIHFDPTLARLDNFGNPSSIPTGNAAQSPNFKNISAHCLELTTNNQTQLGNGYVAYKGEETTAGGLNAIDFDQAVITANNEIVYQTSLSNITPGIYKWLRVSLSYQNYDIKYLTGGIDYFGTIASFIGFNNYITNYTVSTQDIAVNGNKRQGYWGLETAGLLFEGQAAETTVPNPIYNTSAIPMGSSVVTGRFPTELLLIGNETQDIIIHINLSTNKSFEWKDLNGDGFFGPSDGTNPGDTVIDMGIRGLFPTWE